MKINFRNEYQARCDLTSPGTLPPARSRSNRAGAVCNRRPVRVDCLEQSRGLEPIMKPTTI